MPTEWLDLKINRLFPIRHQIKPQAKEAFSGILVTSIIDKLQQSSKSKDKIMATLALRDLMILILGFGHLLRRSEIVLIRISHINLVEETLLVPKSKTD